MEEAEAIEKIAASGALPVVEEPIADDINAEPSHFSGASPVLEEPTGDDSNAEPTHSGPVNMDEETTALDQDESDKGVEKEETNDDGKVEKVIPDAILEGEKVKEGNNGEQENDMKVESMSSKKVNQKRKRRKKTTANAATIDEGMTSFDHDESQEGVKKKEVNDNGKLENAAHDIIPEAEKVKEENNKEESDGKLETTSNVAKRMRKRRKKATANAAITNDGSKLSTADKPATSAADKKDLKANGKGLIFMCSAKTKSDCFRYKVFGLPASKKQIVAKVYKGMRLFLFDVDLKVMYGIYKAASPGGYNIEPKAFKSAFPSQVRFTVLTDCLPLPEEKFKAAIKGNYYGKNKFNCQLSAEQVKDLCKLFESASKTSKKKQRGESSRRERSPVSTDRDRRRRLPRERERRRTAVGDRDNSRRSDLYARQAYASPPRLVAVPPPSLPPVAYAYDRTVDDYYHRRDPPLLPLELRDHRMMDLEIRPRELVEYRDPYSLYREPPRYREPLYPATASLPSSAYAPLPPLYRRY